LFAIVAGIDDRFVPDEERPEGREGSKQSSEEFDWISVLVNGEFSWVAIVYLVANIIAKFRQLRVQLNFEGIILKVDLKIIQKKTEIFEWGEVDTFPVLNGEGPCKKRSK